MQENILGRENVSTLFIKYSIPAIISMVITGMQTMIDGMFVGNILGPNAIASINVANPFYQIIIALSMITSIGSQSYMGLSLGEKDIEKTQSIFKTTIIFIIIVGLIVTGVGLTFNNEIAIILGASDILLNDVSTYVSTISIFTIPMCLMFLFGFSGRIVEKPQLYFYGSILSLLTNITLNYLLIYKFNLGVLGAATATGLSYSSALLVVIGPMLNKNNVINVFSGKFSLKTLTPVLYNGASEGINSLSAALSAYLFNMAFMRMTSEIGIAAFTAISYVAQFGTFLSFGVSDGIGPIISYNYGAASYERVKQVMKISYKTILFMGVLIFTILFFFGDSLSMVFVGNNKEILEISSIGAKIYAFAFFMNGFNIVNSGYFTYIGYAKESVLIAASRGLIFITVGIFVLPRIFDANGVWLSIPFAELITFIIAYTLMRKSYSKMNSKISS